MVFTLVTELNYGFMVGKPNSLGSSLKMTIPQSLLTTLNPLNITSSGITLIFWRRAKQAKHEIFQGIKKATEGSIVYKSPWGTYVM